MPTAPNQPHHVVIVGAGFGGLETAFGLAGAPVRITLIDRRNHHLFQPLLYQVATASLATSEIAWPIRYLLRDRADRILFDTDQFEIDSQDQSILQSQAQWLQANPNIRVTIEGHADERGTRDYNLALGEKRANSAKNYLASLGIASSRITTISYGKERPAAMGSDESAWAQNRRAVTVTVQY